ncbi:MAG: glycosyltransferase family 87 protein [Planctomycetota bacterium]
MNIEHRQQQIVRVLDWKGVPILLLVLIGLIIAATGWRTLRNYSQPGEFNWTHRGHSDFHNGTYYPSIAFRNGDNPYAKKVVDQYPLAAPSRPCPPITYIVHQPFTWFNLSTADVLFFVYNVLLILVLAWISVFWIAPDASLKFWLAAALMAFVSRPGHISLFTGYYTVELVVATLVALKYAESRPWVSAIGMLIASSKPTYILPLILLMLARKNFKAAVKGIGLCTLAGVLGLAWLTIDSSWGEVIQGIRSGQEAFHEDVTEYPINSWTRVDIVAMVAKFANWIPGDEVYLLGMLVLIAIPCYLIWTLPQPSNQSVLGCTSTWILLLSMLVTIYHHSYDCLLIFGPWVGVVFFPGKVAPELRDWQKNTLAFLWSIPLFNYVSTKSVLSMMGLTQANIAWQGIAASNSVALCVSLSLLMIWVKTQTSKSKFRLDRADPS